MRARTRPHPIPGRRALRLWAAVLAAGLGTAACGSSSSSTASRSTPAAPSATSTATTTATATTATSTQTAATATAAAVSTCVTARLRLSLASAQGAAGTAYMYYDLTNIGPSACSMSGYPGVAVLDAHGHIVQHPARRGARQPAPVTRVTLRPEEHARFLVNSTDVIPSPGCPKSYSGTTLQVYPPNRRTALLLSHTGSFCNLRVGPVQPAG
jgi:hypothetical protein